MKQSKLENWTIVQDTDNNCVPVLVGTVYEDDQIPDGTVIVTEQFIEGRDNLAMTKDRLYSLGQPSESFLKWFKSHKGKDLNITCPFRVG